MTVLNRKTIELVEVGPNFCVDTLYDNPAYDDTFVIETIYGEIYTVSLTWEQGRYNNYRFVKGSDIFGYKESDIIWPKDVAYIEVR